MTRTKLISIIAVGLLLSNLALTWFLYSGKPEHRRHRSPKEVIIKRLDLDNAQQKEYTLLIQDHRRSLNQIDAKIAQLKDQIYGSLAAGNNTLNKDSLFKLISAEQEQVERINYEHFQDIKDLCRDDQLEKFNDLMADIGRIFGPPKKPRKPRRP